MKKIMLVHHLVFITYTPPLLPKRLLNTPQAAGWPTPMHHLLQVESDSTEGGEEEEEEGVGGTNPTPQPPFLWNC